MSNDYLTGNELAAIRTALMCDTPVSMAASLLPEGHVLDTAAYRDAIRTVKKLITLRARIAELEAMVRELLNNWFISGEAREKALALLNQEERNP